MAIECMKWLFLLFLSPIPKRFDKVILRAMPCCVFGRDADGWGVPERPFVTHRTLRSLPFALCPRQVTTLCTLACTFRRATTAGGATDASPATRRNGSGRSTVPRVTSPTLTNPMQTSSNLWVSSFTPAYRVCLCVCVYLRVGGWVYSKQPVNYTYRRVGWGGGKELKKYPSTEFRDDAGFSGSGFRLQWMEEEKRQKKPKTTRMFHNRI